MQFYYIYYTFNLYLKPKFYWKLAILKNYHNYYFIKNVNFLKFVFNFFQLLLIQTASSLAAISIWSISIIIICSDRIKSFSISSDFYPDDVIGNAPDVTWNSNWPTWKSFYSFPGRLLENPACLHGKPCLSHWIWMDLIRRNYNF